jgi:ribosomal protein S27AE
MSEKHYEIADCPKCGKRDFVDKDDTQWVCLSCGFSQDISQSEPKPSSGIGGMWLWVLLTTLIWMALMA